MRAHPHLARDGSHVRIERHQSQAPAEQVSLDRWRSAVGPPLVVNAFDATAGTGQADVAVVSWNVHGDAGDLFALVKHLRERHGRSDARRTPLVLLLQEVVRRGDEVPAELPPLARVAAALRGRRLHDREARMPLPDIARALRLNLVYVPSMRNGRSPSDRGNAILSSFPLERVEAFELPLGRQRRVAVAVTVRTGRVLRPRLRLVSVHFDTAVLPFRGGPARWRERQAAALIANLGSAHIPTIIGGDLNTWWGSDEPAVIRLRRAYPEAMEPARIRETWRGPFGTRNRLDYLFAAHWGHPIEVTRLGDRFGSDHTPVFASVHLDGPS